MSRAAARTVLRVDFAAKRPQRPASAPQGRVPRVTQMLALAHRIESMVRTGELRDYADAARRLGMTSARVSQLLGLTLLAPTIQEAILTLPPIAGREPVTERQLRPLVGQPDWNKQIEMWREIR